MFQRLKLLYLYSIKVISSAKETAFVLARLYLDDSFPNRFREENCEKARSFFSFVHEKVSIQSDKY